ncbi:hypothetical protein RN001_001001 [Aquatica leii]|uniref:Transposable element P transposase-like RNase H domain-containing protein n=1 Tax=Aquatica leii TaxID=1421715 RepID=A0AAN7SSJ8_9COLE|nr:hypothetical protein RN001_001001 [Aquatica leii]
MLEFVKNYVIDYTTKDGLKFISKILNKLEVETNSDEHLQKLKFIGEQINLLNSNKRTYCTDTLIWASTISFTFPGAYRLIEDSNILTLPNSQYLKRLLLKLGPNNSGINGNHVKYLTEKRKVLSDKEKYVILLLDEIYVSSNISYKGGKIEGFATEKGSDLSVSDEQSLIPATTIQAFMISSIYSSYKDITDDLEGRFGQYRLMSGGNYHISVMQVLESERKLKLLSVLELKSSYNGSFIVDNLLLTKERKNIDLDTHVEFDDIFLDAVILTNDEIISENETRVLIYIAGYIARVVNKKLNCESCCNFLCFRTNLDVELPNSAEFSYIQSLDRGGLKCCSTHYITYIFAL